MSLRQTIQTVVKERRRDEEGLASRHKAERSAAIGPLAQKRFALLTGEQAIASYIRLHARTAGPDAEGIVHVVPVGCRAHLATPFRDRFLIDEQVAVEFAEPVDLTLPLARQIAASPEAARRLDQFERDGVAVDFTSDPEGRLVLAFDYGRALAPARRDAPRPNSRSYTYLSQQYVR